MLTDDLSSNEQRPLHHNSQPTMPVTDSEESDTEAADLLRPFDEQEYQYEGMEDVEGLGDGYDDLERLEHWQQEVIPTQWGMAVSNFGGYVTNPLQICTRCSLFGCNRPTTASSI